jgi:drug/metabolite transporter (DMT)-like permease
MVAALLGLVGAIVYGGSDFLGGLASRRISPVRVTAIAGASGLVLLCVAYPFFGGVWSGPAALWGALSGVAGAIAISLLYASLAIGPMSILSPLTAVVSAIVPVTVGILGGDRLAPIGYFALGLALVAVVLVGFVPEKGAVRPSLRGILFAVGSGAMIGVLLIMLDLSPDDSGLVPLMFNRAVNASILGMTVLVLALLAGPRRSRARGEDAVAGAIGSGNGTVLSLRNALILAFVCGLVDATANTLLLLGLRLGELSVISVLTALYPAGTIILAAIVLRERVAPVQIVGLVLALIAAALLALS